MDYPTLTIIAHDPGCTITTTGRCGGDCEPVRKTLVGDSKLPLLADRPAPIDYTHRLAKLKAGIEANKTKGAFLL